MNESVNNGNESQNNQVVENNNNNTYQVPNEIMYETPEELKKDLKKEKKNKVLTFVKDVIITIIIIIVVLLIKKYVVTPVQVKGDSMHPTLLGGDYMLLDKVTYKFRGLKRFDIIVLHNEDVVTGEDVLIIKRIIGLPNEHLEIKNNVLYIDGKEVKQDFLNDDVVTNDMVADIKDNCYFVLGDNRGDSLDSEELGCFDISKIEGTASFTIFPFDRFGDKD